MFKKGRSNAFRVSERLDILGGRKQKFCGTYNTVKKRLKFIFSFSYRKET